VLWQEGVRPLLLIELLSLAFKMKIWGEKSPKATWKMEGLRANFGSALLHTFNRYNNDELQAFGLGQSVSSNGIVGRKDLDA